MLSRKLDECDESESPLQVTNDEDDFDEHAMLDCTGIRHCVDFVLLRLLGADFASFFFRLPKRLGAFGSAAFFVLCAVVALFAALLLFDAVTVLLDSTFIVGAAVVCRFITASSLAHKKSNGNSPLKSGLCSTSVSKPIYFMANRNVVIFVSFSLVGPASSTAMLCGTQCRKFSNAVLISRMRVRSRALAVFRRYLLSGGAFDLDAVLLCVRCCPVAVSISSAMCKGAYINTEVLLFQVLRVRRRIV